MKESVENALKEFLRNGPLYKRVGNASYCLLFLKESDFSPELEADFRCAFSANGSQLYSECTGS